MFVEFIVTRGQEACQEKSFQLKSALAQGL